MPSRSKKFPRRPPIIPSGPLTLDDDRVWPVPVFCELFANISVDTFERLRKAGDGPLITRLSANRIGVRGRHGKAWLDARTKPAA